MEQQQEIGVLATIEDGQTRLRPMAFTRIDGECWAAASRKHGRYLEACEGQHVEVLLLDADGADDHVHGVLQSSMDREDRQRLWDAQHAEISRWCRGADDPDFVILKVIPDDERRAARAHRWEGRRKAA